MKAIVLRTTGSPGVLQVSDVPVPSVGDEECLIRIAYSGVNYADVLARQGLYNWQAKRPYILGLESSGVVECVGGRVTRTKVGDAVVVGSKSGHYAEFLVAHEDIVRPVPLGMSLAQAAILCGSWLTAWCALVELARIKPGDLVLIHAGAGGLGTAAIQLCTAHGLRVYATAGSAAKREYVASLGATPLEYGTFRSALQESRPDCILESVGGEVHEDSLAILAPLGRIVSLGASSIKVDKRNPYSWFRAWQSLPRISRSALNSRGYSTLHIGWLQEEHPKRLAEPWSRMVKFMETHRLKPLLQEGAIYPLSQAGVAHQLLDSRQNIGRLLLDPTAPD
jgi:NADPH2:quinone reductase